MKLRAIPPANRNPSRLSSMRAATRVGITFVGGHIGPAAQSRAADSFKAATVEPDKARIVALRAYRAAIRERVQWLEEQAQAAATPEEREWWKAEFAKVHSERKV